MAEESKLEYAVVKYAQQKGILTFKLTSPANPGVPDRIFIFKGGHHLYLEFKAPKKRPTPKQAFFIEKLLNQGCLAAWIDDKQAAFDMIDRLLYATEELGGINPVIPYLQQYGEPE
jgi:hypothetical protein